MKHPVPRKHLPKHHESAMNCVMIKNCLFSLVIPGGRQAYIASPFQNLYPFYIRWAIAFPRVLDYTDTQEESLVGATTYSRGEGHLRSC